MWNFIWYLGYKQYKFLVVSVVSQSIKDSKQSWDPVALPFSDHPSPAVLPLPFPVRSGFLLWHWSIAYVSSYIEDGSWCSDPRLGVEFRRFLRLGSFPSCWRLANVTPIPKGYILLLSGQLQTTNTFNVQGVWPSGITFLAVYGMQRCASNHAVR